MLSSDCNPRLSAIFPASALPTAAVSALESDTQFARRHAIRRLRTIALVAAISSVVCVYSVAQTAHVSSVLFESVVLDNSNVQPVAVAVDAVGDIYYVDNDTNTLYEETPTTTGYAQTTVASFGKDNVGAIAIDTGRNLYVAIINDIPNGGTAIGLVYKEAYSTTTKKYTQSEIATSGLLGPQGIAVDASRNVYLSDTGNNRILEFQNTGSVSAPIYKTQTALAIAGLNNPMGLSVDASGYLYIADEGNNRVVREGLVGTSYIQKIIGSGQVNPFSVAASSSVIYIADTGNNRVLQETVSGTASSPVYTQSVLSTSQLGETYALAYSSGELFIADSSSGKILEEQILGNSLNFGSISIGNKSQVATVGFTFDTAGTIGTPAVLTEGINDAALDFANAGTGTCTASTAYAVGAICNVEVTFSPAYTGARYGAIALNNSSGTPIATAYVAGEGLAPQLSFSPETQTTLSIPVGQTSPGSVAVDGAGSVYFIDGTTKKVYKDTPNSTSYTETAVGTGLTAPGVLTVDGGGNVYISQNNSVLKELRTSSGYVQKTIYSFVSGEQILALAADASGDVYALVRIVGSTSDTYFVGELIPGSSGTYTELLLAPTGQNNNVGLSDPKGMAVDGNGNLYLLDTEDVFEWTGAGANRSAAPIELNNGAARLAVDANGDIFLVGNETQLTMAVQSGTTPYSAITLDATGLLNPQGIAVDERGIVYIADTGNGRLLKDDFSSPAPHSFSSTEGATQAPAQTAKVFNLGNQTLNFPIPTTGNNPSIVGNFTLSSGSIGCPVLSSSASTAGTLAAGEYCDLVVNFAPTAVGTSTGSVTLTDNNLNKTGATQKIVLSGVLNKSTPVITWPTPAPIVHGTALSSTQLNATASFGGTALAGTFVYTPPAGTILSTGTQTLSVTFTPTDTADYTTAKATVTLVVDALPVPVISWSAPTAIVYGTPLSATQLNATASYNGTAVTGTFTYTPSAGKVLPVGTQTLSVSFTPTNTAQYLSSSGTTTIVVTQAALTVIADSFVRTYGGANPTFTASYIGLVNGDTATTAVTGAPVLSTTANKYYPWGLYDISISVGTLSSTNYTISLLVPGTLWITQAPLTVTANNASAVVGAALPALTYSFSGFVNAETASVVSGAPTETTTAIQGSPAGTYPITISQGTLSALNYSFVYQPGTLMITAAAAKPAFSHPSGTYATQQTVTISDATPGAIIFYTTNGTTPTTSSARYSKAIVVSATQTIRAFAVATGKPASAVVEVQYKIE